VTEVRRIDLRKPLPCPWCIHRGVASDPKTYRAVWRPRRFLVECACGARGPYQEDESSAVALWNRVVADAGLGAEDGGAEPPPLSASSGRIELQRPCPVHGVLAIRGVVFDGLRCTVGWACGCEETIEPVFSGGRYVWYKHVPQ